MNAGTPEPCDNCQNAALELVYKPQSERGLSVWLCGHCGLVQSLPRRDRGKLKCATVSSGAGWGNVRYGKGFRVDETMAVLAPYVDPEQRLRILDVGSNRGGFVTAARDAWARAAIIAVEPDGRVVDDYRCSAAIHVMTDRIENTDLQDSDFDLVHSCHTLEHLKSAQWALDHHWRVLKPGGLLFLDLPNIELIGQDDVVEEWFIDKHLYHYSAEGLIEQLERGGFEIIVEPDPLDRVNVTLIARKSQRLSRTCPANPQLVDRMRQLIDTYGRGRTQKIAKLKEAASRIETLKDKRVVIWGAGRLFDCLVSQGELNTSCLAGVVDSYLPNYVDALHGVSLRRPNDIETLAPDTIVVMSRSFADEITCEAKRLAPNAQIIPYASLLSETAVPATYS